MMLALELIDMQRISLTQQVPVEEPKLGQLEPVRAHSCKPQGSPTCSAWSPCCTSICALLLQYIPSKVDWKGHAKESKE